MKKLLTILISAILLLSCMSGFAAEKDELSAIGADTAILNSDGNEYITRAEFAHLSARLIDSEEKTAHVSPFDDVNQSDKYAGDIQFLKNMGIIGGAYDNMFLPDEKLTLEASYKIVSNVMGYESLALSLGGFPNGYVRLALETGLSLNTESKDGFLTKNGAVKMISYALTAKLHNFSYIVRDGELEMIPSNTADTTLLAKLGISAYTGFAEGEGNTKGSLIFNVLKNKYDSNPEYLEGGTKLILKLPEGYDSYGFEKLNVLVWVNENDEIIYIQPLKNNNVYYGYIDSVNGKTDDVGYGIKYISRITLLNDEEEYDVAEGAELKFNGKETTAAAKLIGNFAKIVIINDEITYIESWEAEEGGIITSKANDELTYIKKENGTVKLKDIDSFNTKLVFINGKVSSFDNIKPDSFFEYAIFDDMIMLNVNETVVTDVLNSVNFSGGEITIGGITYKMKDLYHSLDGTSYTNEKNLSSLFKTTVKAYFSQSGHVRYIAPENTEETSKIKFFGVVLGTKSDTFGENREIKLYRIYDDSFKEETYKVSEKAELNSIEWTTIQRSAKNLDGEGVFEFSVNADGLITEISYPRLFEGFGTATRNYSTGSFTSVGTPYVTINGKALYFPGSKMVCLYELDGKFSIGTIDWMTSLYGQSLSESLTLSFYRDDSDGTYPALVIITGGVNKIAYRESRFGMYAGYSESLDTNGDKCFNVHVYTGQKEYKTFKVTEDFIKTNFKDVKYGLLTYKDEYLFAENKISVSSLIDLSAESVDWTLVSEENKSGMHKGTIKRVDNNRLWLSNGEIYFMNGLTSTRLFFELNENMPSDRALKVIDYTDLTPGDEVYYYLSGSLTVSVIIKVV